jgi:transcription termination factor Rho
MAEQQLERSMLDGKDREQLHAIAGAMGIKGVTRLRKADLVDAILEAASGNGGTTNGAANGARKATKATKATKTTKSEAKAGDDADPADAPADAAPARRSVRSKRASELESRGRADDRSRGRGRVVRRGQPHRPAPAAAGP